MADKIRIWVRTSALDIAIHGKVKSTTQRTIPGATADDSTSHHWGWSRGRIIIDEDDAVKHTASNMEQKLEYTNDEEIKIEIMDGESPHHRQQVVLKGSSFQNGDVVMDNVYGTEKQGAHHDDHDDYYSDEEDEYGAENDDKYPDDLITLTHLHEASVLYCLRKRYGMNKIYTSTGPILIALNPFKNCKQFYSEKIMKKYWERGEKRMSGMLNDTSSHSEGSSDDGQDDYLPPHVYSVADDSFRKMMGKLGESKTPSSPAGGRRRITPTRPTSTSASSCNQSILVSGESGAGKTVTTKFIMQYLATLSKRCSTASPLDAEGKKSDIEQQVLQSNPILESFGNARTIRNDNSSRFGKFIEIQFTDDGHLAGASIETYLLEKVRLISQMEGERNYHIFYEMMEGLSDEELDRYFLSDYRIDDFLMTNQSGTYDRRDGVSDYDTYQDLLVAMDTMGFDGDEQKDIMTIACALLHSSNLTFNSITADESEVNRENEHLKPFLSLMGLTADDLNRALCYFSITAGRETHLRSLSEEKAMKGLLALIKTVYGALFTYIVKRVNESITILHSKSKGENRKRITAAASIGVLDIFGFESFETNSFEQLCINYCNETLQQQFNLFVLKNEQEEYEREGIKWSYVSFPDNNDVLTLISKKGAGILSILDDQCRAPGTTDKTFINYLYQKVSRQKRFQADYRQVGARKFAIIHYAGTVEYSSEGFVEKNRDELPKEAAELLLSSTNKFLRGLAEIISGSETSSKDATKKSPVRTTSKSITVGGQFSRQLSELRQKIDLTTPHYVRCLKPNDELVPDNFDPLIVADQLRCAGVVEAVRVSRLGYPQRYSHSRFVARYLLIGQKDLKKDNGATRRRKPVVALVEAVAERISRISNESVGSENGEKTTRPDLVAIGIQVGKTKVFLRRSAFETLERLRSFEMRNAAISLQAFARRCIAHERFALSKRSSITLQCFIRKVMACRAVNERRRNYNATIIQTEFRRISARSRFVSILYVCKALQSIHRGNTGRKRYQQLNMERKAIVIQKNWKMVQDKNRYINLRLAAITIQCAVRCIKAKMKAKKMKKAARDLRNTSQERDQFREENKKLGKRLTDALAKLAEANAALNDDTMEKEMKTLEARVAQLQQELKAAQNSIREGKIKAKEDESSLRDSLQELYSVQEKGLRTQVSQLEELYDLKEKETVQCRDDIEMLKEELKLTASRNAELLENEEKMDTDLRALREENDALENLLSSAQGEVNSLTESISHLKESATSSASELASIKAGKQDLLDRVSEQEQQIKALDAIKSEKESLLGKVESLNQKVSTVNGDLTNLRQERDSLKRNLEIVEVDLSQSKNEALHLRQAIESSQLATTSLTTALAVNKKENETLSRKVEDQGKQIEKLSNVKAENDELLQEKSRLNEQLNALVNDDMASLRDVNIESERNLSKVREELREAQSDHKNLSQNIEYQKQQIENMDNENKVLSDEVDKLRAELESGTVQVGNLEKEKSTLNEALHDAKNELQSSESELALLQENANTMSIEVAKLKAENDRLKKLIQGQEQQVEAMSQVEAQRNELVSEIEQLREDLISTKSANEQLRAMKEKLHGVGTPESNLRINDMNPIWFKASDLSSEDEAKLSDAGQKDLEIESLKEIISSLKAELKNASRLDPVGDYDIQGNDPYVLKLKLEETKSSSAQEILTLQDEVERLNQEISGMKSVPSDVGSKAPVTDIQTSKLIDSIMAKDEEIRDLRREISILRDQLDSTTISMLTESQSHLQHGRIVDDDERSVMSRIFGRSQQPRGTPSIKGIDNQEVSQLRSTNESLRKELETTKRELDELEQSLQAEKEKSAREIEAFAGALDGVDELRLAAEQMSREITRLKNQKDDEVPEDPFDDISTAAMEDLESGIENFSNAKRKIGNASLKSEQKGIWGRLKLNVRSLQDEGDGLKSKKNGSALSKRRGGKENDDSSIFSSFF